MLPLRAADVLLIFNGGGEDAPCCCWTAAFSLFTSLEEVTGWLAFRGEAALLLERGERWAAGEVLIHR